uniref:Uncharacterized protein n=1 Tax=Glossina pallidipes TaxID=7398 RepID=A0A1A9ZZA8_GLOPL
MKFVYLYMREPMNSSDVLSKTIFIYLVLSLAETIVLTHWLIEQSAFVLGFVTTCLTHEHLYISVRVLFLEAAINAHSAVYSSTMEKKQNTEACTMEHRRAIDDICKYIPVSFELLTYYGVNYLPLVSARSSNVDSFYVPLGYENQMSRYHVSAVLREKCAEEKNV